MALRKSVTDLRNKDFMKISRNAVIGIDINNRISMKKARNEVITVNDGEEVDAFKAGIAFLLFSTLEAMDFTPENADAKDYGFNESSRKITLHLDDKSEITYILSKVDVHIYAKLENDDKIYEVNPNVYTNDWYDLDYYKKESTDKEQATLATVLNPTTFRSFDEEYGDFVPFDVNPSE